MKRLFALFALLIAAASANAQFTSGQVLTATQLNNALSQPAITGGSINGAPVGATTPSTGAFTTLSTTGAATLPSVAITGGTITGLSAPIPQASGGTGTTTATGTGSVVLSASPTITGTATAAALVAGNQSWLTALIPNTIANANLNSISTFGGSGVMGATRTSDNPNTGSMGAQGGAFFGINDNTAHVQTAYASYFESRRYAGAGTTHGLESDILNLGSVVTVDPYQMIQSGMTPNLWLSSGRTDVTSGAANATMAVGVINNNTAYESGLMFQSGSLNAGSGEGAAFVLPATYGTVWYGAAATKVARIRSDATSASLGLVFGNGALNFQTMAGANVAALTTGGALTLTSGQGSAGALQITDTTAGQGANIKLTGDGATTPTKYLRVQAGVLCMINSAYNATPFCVTDTGGVTAAGVVNGQGGIQSNGIPINPVLSGTTGSIGGGALGAGACTSGTVSVASSTTAMSVVATPATYPGDGIFWNGYVSAAGTVTVKVCASVAATPTASAYNVRVLQ